MDKDTIAKLRELASDTDKAALEVLCNACESKFEIYKQADSRANLSEWQAAEKALKSKVDELSAKYLDPAGTRVLADRIEAWRFLQSEGYKVGRQTVYNAAASGKLIMQPDGTITESDALAYAAKNLKRAASKAGKPDKIAEQRAAEELELVRIKRAKLEFDFKKDRGLYLLKTDVRSEIAIKIAVLEAGIKHFFRTFASDWIHRVGGDPQKVQMLLEWINAEFDSLLNEFGRMEDIGVVVVKDDDGIAAGDADPEGGIFDMEDTERKETCDGIVGDS
jgi:hypothetical protein